MATNYAYNLCEADDTLVELDSYLKEQGMEGLGYSSQTDAIDQITLWYGYLTAFVDNLPYQIDGYLDQPLYKGFVNGATEWLSRIRLEEFTTKNVLGIQTEEWYTDMYGEEYAIAYDKDTISMLDFLGLGGGEEDFIRLGNVPEEFEAFTRIFSDQYDMMKESLIDADGNQMSMEDYLGQIAEYGEFNNTMDKPLEKFAENLLDILIIPPIIEMCTGKELLTGDDLSDTEWLIKGVTALVGLFTLGQAGAAFKGASFLSKEALIYMGKMIAVDMAATTVSYGVGQMCEELNLPVPLTLIVSIAAGMTVSKVGTKYILKDGLGNTVMELDEVVEGGTETCWDDLMSPEDAAKYNNWVDLRETGLDQVKINDIILTNKGYRPDPATYLSQEYIDAHLELFSDGVVKISATTPIGQAGPPGGTFVMPKLVADEIIREANGDVSKLEQLLSLDPGTLGDSPVRLDILEPQGLRMPSGNELGANETWIPGGSTGGGIPEATIDSPLQGEFESTPIFE